MHPVPCRASATVPDSPEPGVTHTDLAKPTLRASTLTNPGSRFARVVAINFPEDFHLQVIVHVGHTHEKERGRRSGAPALHAR